MVGIVDEALPEGAKDALNITTYKDALVRFIKRTNTPMTIGVQGEWGSGKTSLLNQIWNELDWFNRNEPGIDDFKQIWINSWEHSLLCSPEECLMKIINEIINELSDADTDKKRSENLKKGVNNIMKGALRIGSSMTLGAAGVDAVDNIFSEGSNSIKELREQLSTLVEDIKRLESNKFGKIIIYVDDLDRIDPKNAVRILELLKNIFNIKDCVFVLAIDYQVVVKGLKDKFGEPSPDNEWEFRAFFDKIIQLPFTMPMGKYDIANYVLGLLEEINYYNGDEDLDPELINQFVTKSIGGNPRSIKRLINSLALISILNDIEISDITDKSSIDKNSAMVLFAMACLQIAHPEVYQLFVDKPNFKDWNEDLAYKETQKAEETDENWEKNFAQAQETEDFDTEWEKCLFRVCYQNKRRRSKATEISQFISLFDEQFDKKLDIVNLIETALGQTAVTNVSSKETGNVRKGAYKRTYVDGYDSWITQLKASIYWEKVKRFVNPEGFPTQKNEETIKRYLDVLKTEPYNAVDFDISKPTDEQGSDYVIKYTATNISVYYKKKKIGAIRLKHSKNKELIDLQAMKHPKYDFKPLILKKSNIEFYNPREITDLDEENRTYKGSLGMFDFMWADINTENANLSTEIIRKLINEGSDIKDNPELLESSMKQKTVTRFFTDHVESFKSANKNSKEYKEAVSFLGEYFKPGNKTILDI